MNNKSIALNILYVPRNTEQIRHICKLNMQFVIYAKKKDLVLKMTTKKPHKVRDHCHYTWKYWGAAHDSCNLNYKTPDEVPVVFHNVSRYDYHFIIKELTEKLKGNLNA